MYLLCYSDGVVPSPSEIDALLGRHCCHALVSDRAFVDDLVIMQSVKQDTTETATQRITARDKWDSDKIIYVDTPDMVNTLLVLLGLGRDDRRRDDMGLMAFEALTIRSSPRRDYTNTRFHKGKLGFVCRDVLGALSAIVYEFGVCTDTILKSMHDIDRKWESHSNKFLDKLSSEESEASTGRVTVTSPGIHGVVMCVAGFEDYVYVRACGRFLLAHQSVMMRHVVNECVRSLVDTECGLHLPVEIIVLLTDFISTDIEHGSSGRRRKRSFEFYEYPHKKTAVQ